jgi:hypothetical protein
MPGRLCVLIRSHCALDLWHRRPKSRCAQWVDELAVLYTATPPEEHNDRAPHKFIPGQKSSWGKFAAHRHRVFPFLQSDGLDGN